MGRTVENHTKVVVNTNSNHTAFTAVDVCKLPTEQPYDNSAPSSGLATGRSAQTTISGNPIAMENTHWTPSRSPGQVGVTSGTTLDAAWVDKGSPDLFIEDTPAARTYDSTKQNQANSSGSVLPGNVQPRAEGATDRAKKKCQLDAWGANCAGGASLGYKGKDKTGDPNYLDVWDTDTINFWARRHDITQTPPAVNVKCEVPTQAGEYHTIWDAKCKVFPLYMRTETKHEHSKDAFVVPASLALENWLNGSVMKSLSEGDMGGAMAAMVGQSMSKFMTNDGANRMENDDGFGRQDYGGSVSPGKGSYLPTRSQQGLAPRDPKSTDPQAQPVRTGEPGGPKSSKMSLDADIRTLLFYAWWWIMPPEIKVTASACAGAREATIRVLPNQQIRFKISIPLGEKFKEYANKKQKKKEDEDKEARDAVDKAQQDAQNAQNQANQAKNAQNAAQQSQANALGRMQAAGAKRDSIGGDTGSAQRGRARQQQKVDKAYDKWKQAGDEAFKQWANYRAAMAKFETAADHLNKAVTAAKTAKKGLTVAQKIANVADSPLTYKFLENFKIAVILEYLRTTDRESGMGWRYYTTATMGQKWTFKFSVDPLISISYTVYFSLLNFVTFYVPGLAQALRRFRIFRCDIYFTIKFGFGVSLNFVKDQHDDFTAPAAEAQISVVAEIGLVVGGAGVDVVKFGVTAPLVINLTFSKPKTKGSLATLTPKFRVSNYYRATLFPDRWYEIEMFSGSIPGLQYLYNQNGSSKFEVGSLPA